METRALIVAVEDYPKSKSLARLEGTIAGAERVAKWLECTLGVPRSQIFFCCSSPSPYSGYGATHSDIQEAVLDLINQGANSTQQLIVFLSGHGVMKLGKPGEIHTDVLLTSDFKSSRVSGGACVRIDELTVHLARSLGAGSHLFFVDACRTVDEVLQPISFGIAPEPTTSGVADWYQLLTAPSGGYAVADSSFVNLLLECLNGDCDLESERVDSGDRWVTFRNVAKKIEEQFQLLRRGIETRCAASKSDCRIRGIRVGGPVRSVVESSGKRLPPVEFLKTYDDIIFLGETNSQLPKMMEQAFALREKRKWVRIQVLSIDDLASHARPKLSLADVIQERDEAEDKLRKLGPECCQEFALYRYKYEGFYGSFWSAVDGRRRAHVVAKLPGLDIRETPSADFVDYHFHREPTVNHYFEAAQAILKNAGTRRIFFVPPTT